ncbi:cation:proton antiporter, partial [Streptomyces sp. NPDC002514]
AAEPRVGPLATAYVLILVVLGPLAARWTEPLRRRVSPGSRRAVAGAAAAEQAEVARANG